MADKGYRLSFTVGGLLLVEAVKVAELYQSSGDWAAVRNTVMAENLLQTRTLSSASRKFRELKARLQPLQPLSLSLLTNGTQEERTQILFFGVCKQYPFVRDFMVSVVREKYFHREIKVSYLDFDAFFNQKADWYKELMQLTTLTRQKLRRAMYQILREAGIISKSNEILSVQLSPRILHAIAEDDLTYLAVFPTDKIAITVQA